MSITRKIGYAIVCNLALLLLAQAGRAGVADTPLPKLKAGPAIHVCSVTGLRFSGSRQTCVACTSTAASDIVVRIEAFDADGRPLGNTVTEATLKKGGTRTFCAGSSSNVRQSIRILPQVPGVEDGSLRVVASSSSLFCTAWHQENDSMGFALQVVKPNH